MWKALWSFLWRWTERGDALQGLFPTRVASAVAVVSGLAVSVWGFFVGLAPPVLLTFGLFFAIGVLGLIAIILHLNRHAKVALAARVDQPAPTALPSPQVSHEPLLRQQLQTAEANVDKARFDVAALKAELAAANGRRERESLDKDRLATENADLALQLRRVNDSHEVVVNDLQHQLREKYWAVEFDARLFEFDPLSAPHDLNVRSTLQMLMTVWQEAFDLAHALLQSQIKELKSTGEDRWEHWVATKYLKPYVEDTSYSVFHRLSQTLESNEDARPLLITASNKYHLVRCWIARIVRIRGVSVTDLPGYAEWRAVDAESLKELGKVLAIQSLKKPGEVIAAFNKKYGYPAVMP